MIHLQTVLLTQRYSVYRYVQQRNATNPHIEPATSKCLVFMLKKWLNWWIKHKNSSTKSSLLELLEKEKSLEKCVSLLTQQFLRLNWSFRGIECYSYMCDKQGPWLSQGEESGAGLWTVKTSFIWKLRIQAMRKTDGRGATGKKKPDEWRGESRLRHHEASLFQLSRYWAFTFPVAMVTAESTGTTKAVELLCVPWELPGSAN